MVERPVYLGLVGMVHPRIVVNAMTRRFDHGAHDRGQHPDAFEGCLATHNPLPRLQDALSLLL